MQVEPKDISKLFRAAEKIKSEVYMSKAIESAQKFCSNQNHSNVDKLMVYLETSKFDKVAADEILAQWRDSLVFLKDKNNMFLLLSMISHNKNVSQHERMYTAVHLYNSGGFHVCYQNFADIAYDKSMDFIHRLEAAKYLFAADEDKEREIAESCLLEMTMDKKYTTEQRYRVISGFLGNKGVRTDMNWGKIMSPYDEDFVYTMQMPFFDDILNDMKYRIFSGEHIMKMKITMPEIKWDVMNMLMKVAECSNIEDAQDLYCIEGEKFTNEIIINLRAISADVILRQGTPEFQLKARQIITELGMSADGDKKNITKVKSIYDNSQNVHNETIDKSVVEFLEKLMSPVDGIYVQLSKKNMSIPVYKSIREDVSTCIRNLVSPTDMEKRNLGYFTLNRIDIDSATFTRYNITVAEVLVLCWCKIQFTKYDKQTVSLLEKELVDNLCQKETECSTGYVNRIVNTFSSTDDSVKISWADQILANIKGRMEKRIRNCDESVMGAIALGSMNDADEEDREIYVNFIKNGLIEIIAEMRPEFVPKHMSSSEFERYIADAEKPWFKFD
jgi:hypothetical protein